MQEQAIAIRSIFLTQLYAYWASLRHGRTLPRRADIDLQALMLALPHVFLVDVDHAGEGEFTFRLAGSFLEAAFGQTMTRRHVEDLKLDGHTDEILSQYRRTVAERAPSVSNLRFVNQDGRQFDYERLLLPLAVGELDRVEMILGGICFKSPLPTPSLSFLSRYHEDHGTL